MKMSILFGCLVLSASASPVFTNSGSASVTCQWVGQGSPSNGYYATYTASGTAIDLGCQDALYTGPQITGGAGSLSAFVNQGGAYRGSSNFDFKSSSTDTGMFSGTGPAAVTFTLDWTVGSGNDVTANEDATADFWFNGTEVWSGEKEGSNWEAPQFTTRQIVITEPIDLGVQFTYQGDVEVTGGGNGAGYAASALVIESIVIPEPNALWLVTVGVAGMAGCKICPKKGNKVLRWVR
jgi:hypothetical protein